MHFKVQVHRSNRAGCIEPVYLHGVIAKLNRLINFEVAFKLSIGAHRKESKSTRSREDPNDNLRTTCESLTRDKEALGLFDDDLARWIDWEKFAVWSDRTHGYTQSICSINLHDLFIDRHYVDWSQFIIDDGEWLPRLRIRQLSIQINRFSQRLHQWLTHRRRGRHRRRNYRLHGRGRALDG